MKTKSLLLLSSCLFTILAYSQDKVFNLNLGYHSNPDAFYFSQAELDSSFNPEASTQFSIGLEYNQYLDDKNIWFLLFKAEYVSRSIVYRFTTPNTGENQFFGDLNASYLDLGFGGGQKIELNKIGTGWSIAFGYGIPLQSDTITSSLPPYPLRIASNRLPYLDLSIPVEEIFEFGGKGYWEIGAAFVVRFYGNALHNFEVDPLLISYGVNLKLGYGF